MRLRYRTLIMLPLLLAVVPAAAQSPQSPRPGCVAQNRDARQDRTEATKDEREALRDRAQAGNAREAQEATRDLREARRDRTEARRELQDNC